jgi:uncharacterized protein (DUF952 family)
MAYFGGLSIAFRAFLVGAQGGGYCPAGKAMVERVYKVLTESAFREAARSGQFAGSSDDARDGFIHLSAGAQLEATLAKHFAGQDGLLLLIVDAARLGPDLKWETSRGGALFPHLYAPLDLAAVLWVDRLPLGPDGRHILPDGAFA